jgi:hypothetical protein
MALQPCPECTRLCSDAALACPQCGFPLQSRVREIRIAIDTIMKAANDIYNWRDSDIPKSVVQASFSSGSPDVAPFLMGLVEVVYADTLGKEVLMPLIHEQAIARFNAG